MSITDTAVDSADIELVDSISDELAGQIAAVTAAAYRVGDLVPGLPVADGVRETPADVRDDLAAGHRLWVARADGRCVASVRAVELPDGDWEVRRLAVAPWARRSGLGRTLLRRLEAAALAAGARRVVLDAVVERGNPAFYARAGFRTAHHFPARDKPLSEVHMERDPQAPARPVAYPEGDPAGAAPLLSWWAVPGGTLCRPGTGPSEAPAGRLLGADCWTGASEAERLALRGELAALADSAGPDGSLYFERPAAQIAAFAQPRLIHTSLLAWWRSPAVRSQRG